MKLEEDRALAAKAEELMKIARLTESMLNHPYLAPMYEAVTFVEAADCPSPMAVDEFWRVYYNPKILVKYPADTLPTMLYHEIHHPLSKHQKRGKDLSYMGHSILGAAGNYEINDNLVEEAEAGALTRNNKPRCKYPDDIQLAKEVNLPDGLIFEQYAQMLYEMMPPPPPGGGEGEEEGCSPGKAPGEGSGATGQNQPWEMEAPTKENDLPGVGKSRQDLITRDVAKKIKEAAEKSRGTVPLHLELLADEIIDPHIPWERELGPMVRHTMNMIPGFDEDTYSRSHRRQDWDSEFLKPGAQKPLPSIAVVADTSGSMLSGDDLACVMGTISSLIKAMGCEIIVIPTDASVKQGTVQKVFNVNKVKLFGGGGTDMGVGIAHACAMKPTPGAIIVATDCETPWPAVKPKVPVVICQIGQGSRHYRLPSWAKVIEIDPTKLKSRLTKRS